MYEYADSRADSLLAGWETARACNTHLAWLASQRTHCFDSLAHAASQTSHSVTQERVELIADLTTHAHIMSDQRSQAEGFARVSEWLTGEPDDPVICGLPRTQLACDVWRYLQDLPTSSDETCPEGESVSHRTKRFTHECSPPVIECSQSCMSATSALDIFSSCTHPAAYLIQALTDPR